VTGQWRLCSSGNRLLGELAHQPRDVRRLDIARRLIVERHGGYDHDRLPTSGDHLEGPPSSLSGRIEAVWPRPSIPCSDRSTQKRLGRLAFIHLLRVMLGLPGA
jgi:hypothetical protein